MALRGHNEQREILDALRKAGTVVYNVEGNALGDAELIKLLEEQPIKRDLVDYSYRSSGATDVLTRTCGWSDSQVCCSFVKRNECCLKKSDLEKFVVQA